MSYAQLDCCDQGDKVQTFTFQYTGESCASSNNSQGSSGNKWDCDDFSGGPGGDESVYIISSKDENGGDVYFSGTVNLNETFSPSSLNANDDKFPSNTYHRVYSSQGGTLLQRLKIHASCSVPVVTGDQFGSLVLVNAEFENGVNCGPSTPQPPGPNCNCQSGIYSVTFTYNGTSGIGGGPYDYHDNELGYWPSLVSGQSYSFNISNTNHDHWHEHNNPTFWTYQNGTWIDHGTMDSSCGTNVLGNSFGPFTVTGWTDLQGNQCALNQECDNVTDAGTISGDEINCDSYDPMMITNVEEASGNSNPGGGNNGGGNNGGGNNNGSGCCNDTHSDGGGHNHVKSLNLLYTGPTGNVNLFTNDGSGGTGTTNITQFVESGETVIFAAAGSQKYGSNADFSYPGGTVDIHTSCSQDDVILGATFGPFQIIGIETANGCSEGDFAPPPPPPTEPIEYQWIQSTAGCPNNIDQAIPGANDLTYNPPLITQTTWYVRLAKRESCEEDVVGEASGWVAGNCIVKEVEACSINVGDKVFSDLNEDGIQDPNEPGVPNVIVRLLSPGPDGQFHTGDDIVEDTDATNGNGNYLFTNVDPGEYCIRFEPSSIPNGFVFSPANTTDDDNDSDVDAVGKTDAFTVLSGQDDLTFDAGIYLADDCANQGGDSDGDGVCDNEDCQPANPAFPTTPGTLCNDGDPNTINDVVLSDGCTCAGTVPNPCANLGGDTDGDGVCDNEDCQPFNPAFPATPGSSCDDGNSNTINDVVQSDECSCAGTPVSGCAVTVDGCNITITGLNSSDYTKIFNSNWQIIWQCNPWQNGGCNNTETFTVSENGTYWVQACGATEAYTISACSNDPCANQGGDSDGDGVCDNEDCQPHNPAYPATPGTPCNDGNPNTINDVVLSDGCTCAGTVPNPCANLGGDTDGDGVCDNEDCQPFNPAFPATPGSSCDDGNSNTINDVVQSDECSCAGTPVSGCAVTVDGCNITITGLNSSDYTKIFNSNWQIIWQCNPWQNGGCNNTETFTVSENGAYWVQACGATEAYTISACSNDPCANQGGDSDGDGVCNHEDCQPHNPAYPATPGTPCNDGNPNTINDVITLNGCDCSGTSVNLPSLIINDLIVHEDVGNAILTITSSNPSTSNITVSYTTVNGTALSGVDYTTVSGIATILAGQTSTTVSVPIIFDAITEVTEQLNVILSNAIGATIADNSGTISILDKTPPGADCGVIAGDCSITINGLASTEYVKVFNSNWQIIWDCNPWVNGGCNTTETISNLSSGLYHVQACGVNQPYTVSCSSNLESLTSDDLFFNALKDGRDVLLTWTTNSEYKNDYFELEHSVDGINFNLFEEVISISDSEEYRNYSDKDTNAKEGINYYRLKQVFTDGSYRYSTIREITFDLDINNFNVYPNPASEYCFVSLHKFAGKAGYLVVQNSLGQTQRTISFSEIPEEVIRLSLHDFASGLYTITLRMNNGRVVTQKLIVTKL